jgi:hypothetical protein
MMAAKTVETSNTMINRVKLWLAFFERLRGESERAGRFFFRLPDLDRDLLIADFRSFGYKKKRTEQVQMLILLNQGQNDRRPV